MSLRHNDCQPVSVMKGDPLLQTSETLPMGLLKLDEQFLASGIKRRHSRPAVAERSRASNALDRYFDKFFDTWT